VGGESGDGDLSPQYGEELEGSKMRFMVRYRSFDTWAPGPCVSD
jgi:hypothetical protein